MTFISYAQNFEDIMLWRALKHVRNGFYIDVGANDPEIDSVTLAFYERGWHGINVEPMRQYHERLRIKRPADINLPFAVGDVTGELTFFDVPDTGLSTADSATADLHARAGQSVNQRQVKVTTLAAICSEHVHGPIHFLKIDVEGFEKAVLRGMDFQRWIPWIIVIEATRPQSQVSIHHEWEGMVIDAGYQFAYFDGLNRYYVSQEHPELLPAFQAPPNFFDHFQLREDHAFSFQVGPLKAALNTKIQEAEIRARDAEAAAAHFRVQLEQVNANIQAQLQHADARIRDALLQAQAANAQQEQARRQVQQAQAELQQAQHQVAAIYASTSWRITRPIRQLKTVMRNPRVVLIKARGLLARMKTLVRKFIVRTVKWAAAQPRIRSYAGRVLLRFPALRTKAKEIAARMSAAPMIATPVSGEVVQSPVDLPISGKRTFSDLQRAINKSE